ncbi:hypothetical protein CCP3SC15_1930005 [Gammaproteobacteria bacterium]
MTYTNELITNIIMAQSAGDIEKEAAAIEELKDWFLQPYKPLIDDLENIQEGIQREYSDALMELYDAKYFLDKFKVAAKLVCDCWGRDDVNWYRPDMDEAVNILRDLLKEEEADNELP